MQEHKNNYQSDWPLIECVARTIYEDDFDVLTKADIKEIEDSIDNGTPFYMKEDESGEMNIGASEIITMVSIALTATDLITRFWRRNGKFLGLFPIGKSNSESEEQSDTERIEPAVVASIIELIINNDKIHTLIREELKRNSERFIEAITSQLRFIRKPDPKNNDKKED